MSEHEDDKTPEAEWIEQLETENAELRGKLEAEERIDERSPVQKLSDAFRERSAD